MTVRLSVIIPATGQAADAAELVRRIGAACAGIDAEIIIVNATRGAGPDGTGGTGGSGPVPVRHVRRDNPRSGFSGAVMEGIATSRATYCLVMGGGLHHPPELIPILLARLEAGHADLAVASRYCGAATPDGNLSGPSRAPGAWRAAFVARVLFPARLRDCSDPLSGFFALRRDAIDPELVQPKSPNVLLDILLRHRLRVEEVPFEFGRHAAGQPKATPAQELRFLRQLGELRIGRAGLFAVVGAIGTVLNLLIMAVLLAFGVHYVAAALVAAELTILTNFVMQEKLVFAGDTRSARVLRHRFAQSVGFNNVEAVLRVPFLLLLVEVLMFNSMIAQAGTLACAFVVRYLFHAKVVYRQRPAESPVAENTDGAPVAAAPAVSEELHASLHQVQRDKQPQAGKEPTTSGAARASISLPAAVLNPLET